MSLEALKSVACPAGDKCNAFHCFFSHPRDKPREEARVDGSVANKASKTRKRDDADEDGREDENGESVHALRKKRIRLDSPPLPVMSAAVRSSAGWSQVVQKSDAISNGKSSSSSNSSSATAATPNSAASSVAGAAGAKTHPRPPAKPESLNPRLVKSSPAKHEVRFALLKLLHAEFSRLNSALKVTGNHPDLVMSPQGVVILALDQEERMANTKGDLYSSAMKHRIIALRRMLHDQWSAERSAELEKANWRKNRLLQQQQQQQQEGKGAALGSAAVLGPPVVIDTGLSPAQEVAIVLAHLLTPITNLSAFGYVAVAPSANDIETARLGVKAAKGMETCDRCSKRFQVFPGRRDDGRLTGGGVCKHHVGKAVPVRPDAPDAESRASKRWTCCGTALGDITGCTESAQHVFKVSSPSRLSLDLPFAQTPENDSAPKDRAVAFDCEMVYTVNGMEMGRLTATAWPSGETILDVLVRPIGEILDLNTKWSGIFPEDMANAELWTLPSAPTVPASPDAANDDKQQASRPVLKMAASPAAARSLLFSLISPSTPLIGHGLENDLNVARIIHPTLVDTVLLFPHARGSLPLRNSLRGLVATHLRRRIQIETGQGHNSAEDARAAGDLVRLRVAEKWDVLKALGWTFSERGMLVAPKEKTKSFL